MMSLHKYKKQQKQYSQSTAIKKFQACSNGCWLYLKENEHYTYPYCNSPNTVTQQQILLGSILSSFVCSESNKKKMEYKKNKVCNTRFQQSSSYTDFYDGMAFRNSLHNGETTELKTIDLAMYVDAFLPFDRSRTKMTLIMFTILNLPPEERLIITKQMG
jgi:hypothetical protein